MKNFFFTITVFLLLAGCGNTGTKNYDELGRNKKFVIEGIIENGEGKKLYLLKISGMPSNPEDSAVIDSNRKFKVESSANYPGLYVLRAESGPFLILSVEGGEKISVEADFNNFSAYTITGSEESKKIQEFGRKTREYIDQVTKLSKITQDSVESPNYAAIKTQLNEEFEKIMDGLRDYSLDFIDKNSGSLATILALRSQIGPQMSVFNPIDDREIFIRVDSVLMATYPKSELVTSMHDELQLMLSQQAEKPQTGLKTGDIAPEISLPSPEGKTLNLSSLKGKYVLLDFWAAWCPPCRAENPNLVEVYKKYNSRGFEIFQVSLDRTKDAWLKGIKDDNLTWMHVSDLKYWDSSVVPLYGIKQIPTSYLLDKEGKVIAADLRGAQLGEKLAEIFK